MQFKQSGIILVLCIFLQIPFLNKAFHIDSDMMVSTASQMIVSPVNPPLGEYGKHMVLHNKTAMPQTSIFFRNPHPPLVPLLLAPVIYFFGENELPVHIFFLIFYILTVFSGYFLFKLYFTQNNLFFATLLWAFSPALFINSQNAMYDVPAAFFTIATIVLFIAGYRSQKNSYFLFSGIMLGLGALTKMTVIPLYPACALFLLLKRGWKSLFFWLIPSLLLPSLWVIHNLIVFGKIQYVSTDHFHPIIGDVRYRCERILSYLGGVVTLPIFWYWLFFRKKLRKELYFLLPVIAWSIVMVLKIKVPIIVAIFYIFFAFAGTIITVHCATMFLWKSEIFTGKKGEMKFLSLFFLLYFSTILFLPLASVRFLIPLVPFAILFFVYMLPGCGNVFRTIVVLTTTVLTLTLSVADALFCDSDRKLPGYLTHYGYTCDKTWYFGRLSFDYYLFKAGFKNFKVLEAIPSEGEFFIDECVPGDYRVYQMLERYTGPVEAVDTIRFHRFPVRTIGGGAGFYGSGRLPYSVSFAHSQREYAVYRVGH
jgi:hypothetical protein